MSKTHTHTVGSRAVLVHSGHNSPCNHSRRAAHQIQALAHHTLQTARLNQTHETLESPHHHLPAAASLLASHLQLAPCHRTRTAGPRSPRRRGRHNGAFDGRPSPTLSIVLIRARLQTYSGDTPLIYPFILAVTAPPTINSRQLEPKIHCCQRTDALMNCQHAQLFVNTPALGLHIRRINAQLA